MPLSDDIQKAMDAINAIPPLMTSVTMRTSLLDRIKATNPGIVTDERSCAAVLSAITVRVDDNLPEEVEFIAETTKERLLCMKNGKMIPLPKFQLFPMCSLHIKDPS